MTDPVKYQRLFEEAASSRDALKSFSEALAKAEAELNLKPKRVLVNGIIRDDQLTATFAVRDKDIAALMAHFLNHPRLNPDIIINGIPVDKFREISINVGHPFGA